MLHSVVRRNRLCIQKMSSARVLRKIKALTTPQPSAQHIINYNPRNLEKLRIAQKPSGYHLEKVGRSYWHQLFIKVSGRYVTAEVRHFENGQVLTASTSEWAIKKQLFKTNDAPAFINLGRVLASRCISSGITEMACYIEAVPGSKLEKFLQVVKDNGVTLQESTRFANPAPWDMDRPEKPGALGESQL